MRERGGRGRGAAVRPPELESEGLPAVLPVLQLQHDVLWRSEQVPRAELEEGVRQVILSSVEVDGLTAADLPSDAPLFGDGVGLDSIDALEIGAALRKKYQVKFKANSDENRVHFRTIASLADFIAAQAGISIEG